MLIMAAAPFPYDLGIGPVKIALSDVSLVLAIPVMLARARRPIGRLLRNPVLPGIAAYFLVCVISIAVNGEFGAAIPSMIQMFLYLVLAMCVYAASVDDRQIFFSGLYGLLASGVVLALLKLSTGEMYLLGLHKNSVGSSMAFFVIVSTELWLASSGDRKRRRTLGIILALMVAALVVSLSRGAWLGAFIGVVLILLLRARWRILIRLAAVAIPVIGLCWLILPEAQKDYATDLSSAAHNVKARLMSIEFAYSQFERSPLIGVGVGLRKQYDATNLIMSTLAETGILGVATFGLILAGFAWAVWRARQSITLADPRFSLLAIGAGLFLAKLMHGMVDHFWGRGALPAWIGGGIALWVYATRHDRTAKQ
jgi:putative inorganic carbon (HCO3(-)) transporter